MQTNLNIGRQVELDYAKGAAILFMIAVHCLETFSTRTVVETSPYGLVVEFFGSFTSATVFMILLGVGVVYSHKAKPRTLAVRGLILLGAGYLLNVLRGFFPMLLTLQLTESREWLPYLWIEPFRIDILQFAGLTFIFFAFTKKFKFEPIAFLVTLVFFEVLNFVLKHNAFYYADIMDYQNPDFFLAAFTGLFWGTSELSSFPFLSWIFYPIIGYVFGLKLIKLEETAKQRFYLRLTAVAFFFFFITVGFCWYYELDYGWQTDEAFYHHEVLGNLVFGSCAFLLIGCICFLRRFVPDSIAKLLMRWSKNVTKIYFTQWIMIGWIAVAIGYQHMGVFQTVVVSLLVLVISDWFASSILGNNMIHKLNFFSKRR